MMHVYIIIITQYNMIMDPIFYLPSCNPESQAIKHSDLDKCYHEEFVSESVSFILNSYIA